eukprot:scaffold30257_cov160-Skeletonema_menzelii.AAC.6
MTLTFITGIEGSDSGGFCFCVWKKNKAVLSRRLSGLSLPTWLFYVGIQFTAEEVIPQTLQARLSFYHFSF